MVSRRAAHRDPLDALVLEVWHVELSACEDYAAFREGVRRITHNLELTLAAVAGLDLSDIHVRRAADQVKLNAVRLLDLCREVPEALHGPEDWRHRKMTIMATYEQFRKIPSLNGTGKLGAGVQRSDMAAAFAIIRFESALQPNALRMNCRRVMPSYYPRLENLRTVPLSD